MSEAREIFVSRFPGLERRVPRSATKPDTVRWPQRTENPEALLARWISGLDLKQDMALVLSGVGEGSQLIALRDALPEGCCVYCAEPNEQRFSRFLDTPLARDILADERFFFGVGELDNEFFSGMADFPVLRIQNADPIIFAPLFAEDEDYYSTFFLQFARQFDYRRKLFGTNVVYSGLWLGNTLQNVRALMPAPDVGALSRLFAGVPMVVASAGPSLDEALDFLRWVQGRAIVVAVNSSFQALRNAGIDPHFVLAADPHKTTDLGFSKVDLGRALLVCPFMVYPKVAQRFVGRALTWSTSSDFVTYLRGRLGLANGDFVTEEGTVSACAFDLARLWGCPSIYFAGQDLAALSDGRTHVKDSFYTDVDMNRTALGKCRWMPGTTQEKVPVEDKLFVYLKTFEKMAKAFGDELVLRNLSRFGARIDGMPYHSIDAAQVELSKEPGYDVERLWKKASAICAKSAVVWSRVDEEMSSFRGYVERCCQTALRNALTLEMIEEISDSELVEARKSQDDLRRQLDEHPSYRILLESGHMKFERFEHEKAARKIDREEEGSKREHALLLSENWAIAEGAYGLLASLEDVERPVDADVSESR